MSSNNIKSGKNIWYETIRIVKAQTDLGVMYYLVDENYDFIILVKDYLNMLQARAQHEVSPNTVKTYCYQLWYFIVFLRMKELDLLELDGRPDILVNFKLWLKNPYRFYRNIDVVGCDIDLDYVDDSLSISSINGIISRVSSLYLWLKAGGKIKENPVIYRNVVATKSMKDKDMLSYTRRNKMMQVNTLKSKVPKVIPKIITQDDFKSFLNTVNLLRDKIILLCFKEGGFRSNELLGIHLEDIDFGEQGIWVKFRANNENESRAKSGYGNDRFVHLPTDLMALIDKYISTEWLNSNTSSDFLFVVIKSNINTHNGNAMTKSTLDSMFKYYSNKIKIHLHAHMLRHTHATELARNYISNGESINWEYISKRLGHKSVTTTIEIYAHLKSEDYKKEYERIQQYIKTK